jgi:hypothetical protein
VGFGVVTEEIRLTQFGYYFLKYSADNVPMKIDACKQANLSQSQTSNVTADAWRAELLLRLHQRNGELGAFGSASLQEAGYQAQRCQC